jgi:hypothetical protein
VNLIKIEIRSMKFSRADNRVKTRKFSDESGTESVPIFRVLLVVWQNPEKGDEINNWNVGRTFTP